MRKGVSVLFLVLFLVFGFKYSDVFAESDSIIGYENLGLIDIKKPENKRGDFLSVQIKKEDKVYSFEVKKDMTITNPFGNGRVLIMLVSWENNKPTLITHKFLNMNVSENVRALQRTNISPGKNGYGVSSVLKKHFKGYNSWNDEKKVLKVYQYVTKNYSYDWDRVKVQGNWYTPDYKRFMKNHKGTCYDIASLTSSLLREMKVPTRLVMGYPQKYIKGYHAWNQVYVNKKWKTIDTTYDLKDTQKNPYKKSDIYKVSYIF